MVHERVGLHGDERQRTLQLYGAFNAKKIIDNRTSHKWRNSSGPGKLGGHFGHITSNPNEESAEGLGAVPIVVVLDIYKSWKGGCD